jgi:hypothetical protein
MYSIDQLTTANVDGITTLFYLQKIYPDEWTNFLERQLSGVDRAQLASRTESHVKDPQELRLWASYRGQTLARTGIEKRKRKLNCSQTIPLVVLYEVSSSCKKFKQFWTIFNDGRIDVFYTTVAQAIQEVKVTDIALTSHG